VHCGRARERVLSVFLLRVINWEGDSVLQTLILYFALVKALCSSQNLLTHEREREREREREF